jgi:hypothetical protein
VRRDHTCLQTSYDAVSHASTYRLALEFNTRSSENNLFSFNGFPDKSEVRVCSASTP